MADTTGTIDNEAVAVIENRTSDALQLSAVNDSGAALTQGQEVIFKTAGTLDKRTAGTQKPFGIVIIGADNGKRATVRTYYHATVNAKAIGGTLNPGAYVVPNGNKDANGIPEYIAAASDDYACAQVIKGGAANAAILVGILQAPVVVP